MPKSTKKKVGVLPPTFSMRDSIASFFLGKSIISQNLIAMTYFQNVIAKGIPHVPIKKRLLISFRRPSRANYANLLSLSFLSESRKRKTGKRRKITIFGASFSKRYFLILKTERFNESCFYIFNAAA